MLYDPSMQKEMIDALKEKEVAIIGNIARVLRTGYTPDKNNYTYKLAWNGMLIDAFENIFLFDKEDQESLERLYYKVMSLI